MNRAVPIMHRRKGADRARVDLFRLARTARRVGMTGMAADRIDNDWQSSSHPMIMETTLSENRLRKQSLPNMLADRIQTSIISSAMAPGSQLPTEPDLMKEYGVSRTVVREAAAILQSRGLVEVRPRCGMTVRAADSSSLVEPLTALLKTNRVSASQLVEVRMGLETAIARSAATARTDDDLKKLSECLEKAEEAKNDHAEALRLDMLFHELLVQATHNPFYAIVTSPVTDLLREMYQQSFTYLANQTDTLDEHRSILDAVTRGDASAAEQAVQMHLERVNDSLRPTESEPEEEADARARR